jgi:hypothetical protein
MDFGLRGVLRRAVVLAVAVAAGPGAAGAVAAVKVEGTSVEEGRPAVFKITNDGSLPEQVQLTTADESATAGSDYTALDASATLLPGQTIERSVATTGDDVLEADETFRLAADPVGPAPATTATATIRNDDPPVIIAALRPAGETSGRQVLAVALVVPTTKPVTVDVATADGTAAAGSDFTAASATLSFAPGEQLKELPITILDDAVFESDEIYEVRLSRPTNAVLAGPSVQGTITEDDPAPTISLEGGGPIAEGNEGTTPVPVRVRLSAPSALPAAVAVITERGTATSPADFTAVQAVVSFAPGETQKDLVVPVKGDDALEPDERLRVLAGSLGGAQNPGGQPVAVIITIRNDDRDTVAPKVTVAAPRLQGSLLTARVACGAGEELCAGQVTFFKDADRRAKDRGVRKEARLGRVAFRLTGGRGRTVRLRVSKARMALLRRAGRAKVTAYVVAEDAARNRVTFRRSARISAR